MNNGGCGVTRSRRVHVEGAGGRGGRSPARRRRAPRAKLVGSGEAGTGCALIFGLQGTTVRGRKQSAGCGD